MRPFLSIPLSIWMLLVAVGTGSCTSPHATQEPSSAQAAAIGTWRYEVEGYAPLNEGTFQITTNNGRLRGIVQDRRLGRLRARVDVGNSRLELSIDDLRISGFIEDDKFTGYLRRRQWDVSTRSRYRQRSRFRSASLFARRVESGVSADKPSSLECEPLLRETNDCS